MRLLIVEDNSRMASLLRQGFSEQGYQVDVAADGRECEAAVGRADYDVIVLDLMLPDVDGLAVCRNLRQRNVSTPILMLTALSTTQNKITGLDAGADDYLTKPFDFEELSARVRALLRRAQSKDAAVLRYEGIEMDLLKRCVFRAGRKVQLSAKEFALLEYFLRNPDRVLTRAMIGEHVWEMDFEPDSNVIDVYVSTLRRRIDRGFPQRLIHTVVGVGYILSAKPPTD